MILSFLIPSITVNCLKNKNMIIIGVIIAIYVFARRAIKNDPLKGQIETALNSVNNYLSLIKRESPYLILDSLSKLALRILILSIIAFILVSAIPLPKEIIFSIKTLVSVIFIFSLLLNVTIEWNRRHKKSVKEVFLNMYSIFLISVPSFLYLLDFLINSNFYNHVFHDLFLIIKTESILVIQLIWAFCLTAIIYAGYWIITFPIYFLLNIMVVTASYTISIIEKYIDIHILDAIIAMLVLIFTIYKVMNMA